MRQSLIFYSLTFVGGLIFMFLLKALRERYVAVGYKKCEEMNELTHVGNE